MVKRSRVSALPSINDNPYRPCSDHTSRTRHAYYGAPVAGADWDHVTVSKIVEQWLDLGRSNVGARTKEGNEEHYLNHIKPHLGGRKIKDLRTDEVERWLLDLSPKLSTSTLKQVKSVLNRSIVWAMKRGYAERNVVEIASVPKGRPGRASRSLNLQQAEDILSKTRDHKMYAYIVVSLLTGLRPEETRALAWNHVYLDGTNEMPPHINVWRSVRVGGDTKTPKSRRSIALSGLVVAALKKHRLDQVEARNAAGSGGRSRDSCSRRTWGHSRTGTTSCACSATLSGSCRR